ncbi:MAG: hypothetical protein BYD32DRAFT_216619 [Podila humilis]|nr:MAG: hypothetical protein BYD32DRAFT_216619 [Podila humilis]
MPSFIRFPCLLFVALGSLFSSLSFLFSYPSFHPSIPSASPPLHSIHYTHPLSFSPTPEIDCPVFSLPVLPHCSLHHVHASAPAAQAAVPSGWPSASRPWRLWWPASIAGYSHSSATSSL